MTTREHPPRRVVVGVALALGVLGLGAVAASALVRHPTPPAVTSTDIAQRLEAAPLVPTTTVPVPTTTVPVPTTTVVVTTTAPPLTTNTAPPAPPPTSTVPHVAVPSTTQAPNTTVAAAPAMTVSLSPAGFPTTPPPYWPMPTVHVTVTNTGGTAINGVVVHPVGVYSVPSNTCSTLAPGQSCGAVVQFCPSSSGHYVNMLVVSGEDAVTGVPVQATTTLDGTAT